MPRETAFWLRPADYATEIDGDGVASFAPGEEIRLDARDFVDLDPGLDDADATALLDALVRCRRALREAVMRGDRTALFEAEREAEAMALILGCKGWAA